MFKNVNLVLVTALLSMFIVVHPGNAQQMTSGLSCATVPLIANGLLSSHVSGRKFDDALAKEAARMFAERIDSSEVLLTQSEYEKFEKRLFNLAKSVRESECNGFQTLHADQVKWQQDMEDFVRKTLTSKRYKMNKKRELNLDPKKRSRPKTQAQQDELRRALIDFQMANYIANGTSKKEAKKKLIHRYELATKRVKDRKLPELYGAFLNAYSNSLDPHSTYFSQEELEDFRITMQLSLEGIGARLSSKDGYTTVEDLVPGGAADKHGKLKTKDQIIAVAQGPKAEPVDVIDMDLREVVRFIRGEKGTQVTLTVLRKGKKLTRHKITIVRDKIDLKESAASLTWHEVKRGKKKEKIAIIDLPSFYMGNRPGDANSTLDVANLLKKAKEGNAAAVVLDLSRNGGGSLQAAVEISGLFVDEGAIVGVKARGIKEPNVLKDRDSSVVWSGPLVVLTSRLSASASEILAGALQDYHRAVVVGDEHTFGKGSVQQLTPLPAGLGALKVTTSVFYLPGGKSTQSIGVPSDIVVPSVFAEMEIGEKFQDHALPAATTKDFKGRNANKSGVWKQVKSSQIKKLKKSSKSRVAKSKDFKELKSEIKKNASADNIVKISEILGESKNGKKDEDEDKKDDKELSIQAKEAAEIAADLVAVR